jgi:hypothetical protein
MTDSNRLPSTGSLCRSGLVITSADMHPDLLLVIGSLQPEFAKPDLGQANQIKDSFSCQAEKTANLNELQFYRPAKLKGRYPLRFILTRS